MNKFHTLTLTAAAAVVFAPFTGHAESLKAEVARLRAENAALKKEVSKLKPEPVKGKWVRQLSAGLLLTSGNNENLNVTGGLSIERQTDEDKFRSFLTAAYGKSAGRTNAQLFRAGAQYNRDLANDYYWYVGTLMEHDKVGGVDFRLGVGPGLGRHIIKNDKVELNFEGGPTYFYEQFTGSGSGDSSFRLRAAENFSYTFAPGAKFYQRFEIMADVSDFGNFIMNNEAGVESTLTERLKLRLNFLDRYVNQPPGRLQQNDIQITSSLVLGF